MLLGAKVKTKFISSYFILENVPKDLYFDVNCRIVETNDLSFDISKIR